MQVTGIRRSVLAGVAVVGCLLASQAALGVIAISGQGGARASGDPIVGDGDWGFDVRGLGPNLGSFQASYADLAVKDEASASASASIDLALGIHAEAGTIAGTLVETAACELATVGAGDGDSGAGSSFYLVFSVPEGQQGVYRLKGLVQESGGFGTVLLRDWDPTTGEPGRRVFASSNYPAGPFDLSGVLSPGLYELDAWIGAHVWLGEGVVRTVGEAASLNLDFSIVPEPATAALMLLSVVVGSVVRRRQ